MKLQSTKGFTLIELLVVITIIGILATGATATYTSQIQKARDTTRMNDVKALQWAIEQVYQDRSEFPPSWSYFIKDGSTTSAGVAVGTYLPKIPKDPKNWQTCNNAGVAGPANTPTCVYTYTVWTDDNWINQWAYVVSTAFESEWKVTTDAKKDWGRVDVRWEAWNGMNKSTPLNISLLQYVETNQGAFKTATWVRSTDGAALSDNSWSTQNTIITINGNN